MLIDKFDIHPGIAVFFADRKPPFNNLFWEKSSVYIRSAGTAHLTIPLFFDLLYKCGFPISHILQENVIQAIEKGFDLCRRNEMGVLDDDEFQKQSLSLVTAITNKELYTNFITYLNSKPSKDGLFGTGYLSLNRADIMLLALCCYTATIEQIRLFLTQWYNLIGCILIMDDYTDIDEDRKKNDMNIFLEVGDNETGNTLVRNLYTSYANGIASINLKLHDYLIRLGHAVYKA